MVTGFGFGLMQLTFSIMLSPCLNILRAPLLVWVKSASAKSQSKVAMYVLMSPLFMVSFSSWAKAVSLDAVNVKASLNARLKSIHQVSLGVPLGSGLFCCFWFKMSSCLLAQLLTLSPLMYVVKATVGLGYS